MNARRVDLRAIRVHIAAIAAYTLGWLALWMQPLFLTEFLRYPHANSTAGGLIMGGEVAALSLSSALCARFAPSVSFRSLLLAGALIVAIGNGLALATHDIVTLGVARVICGVGEGITLMVSYAALASSKDPDRAYAHLALWSSRLATIAFHFAPAIGALAHGQQTLPTLLIGSALLWIWIAAFLFLSVDAATWPFYFVLGLGTGLGADRVNNAIALSIIASIAGSLLALVLGSRFGRRAPFAAGLCLTALAVVLMVDGNTPATYVLGINLTMFASYFVIPFFTGVAANQDPSGRGVALVGTAGPLAFSLGAGVGGFIWEYAGQTAISCICVAACLSAGLIINSIIPAATASLTRPCK